MEKLTLPQILEEIEVYFQNEGQTLAVALSDAIQKAARSAVSCNKKAVVKMEITFAPGRERVMGVTADVTLKEPKIKSDPVTLYHGKDGELFMEDPRQKNLPHIFSADEGRKVNAG